MRVLVSAYACNPYRGSEDAVGWGWLRAAAKNHDVHVITAAFQQEHVERWQAEHPDDDRNPTFHYVRPRRFHYGPSKSWLRIESSFLKPLMNLAYAHWLRDAGRLAKSLDEQHAFALVHLVTYVGYRFPGTYWSMRPPFVWGPIGGLENTAWRLLPSIGSFGAVYHAVRNIINAAQKRMLPSARKAFQAARVVIAATAGIQRQIKKHYRVHAEVLCEVGLSGEIDTQSSTREPGEPLRLAWSGLHLPRKALLFLLHALAQVDKSLAWELVVLGRGPCTADWKQIADDLGLEPHIRWTGWIEREAALQEMRAAHVFVITSIEDLTSTVLIEALGHGLPVVCPDHCGFADVVTADCGVKVAVDTPESLRLGLARAIEALGRDEDERRRLAKGALVRAADYTWDEKARRLDRMYAAAVLDHEPARASAAQASARVGTASPW
ncbi:MAG: glycosyltransferase family 4 protein [Planctomycetota bacterium]|nr:glycosyltransferase family 4 protein [Planctomycetota bacterium]